MDITSLIMARQYENKPQGKFWEDLAISRLGTVEGLAKGFRLSLDGEEDLHKGTDFLFQGIRFDITFNPAKGGRFIELNLQEIFPCPTTWGCRPRIRVSNGRVEFEQPVIVLEMISRNGRHPGQDAVSLIGDTLIGESGMEYLDVLIEHMLEMLPDAYCQGGTPEWHLRWCKGLRGKRKNFLVISYDGIRWFDSTIRNKFSIIVLRVGL